ncbi:hypothetical protein AVEN_275432-1 [Araneus ventricosus]|uniref:Uncharacterized protein n=1 Tax=Araneus ventricosus TaxID=182803 RepID=A0A4Y2LAI1_ARAVE|nr:hypothetical protein AVEN_275432-1 [Araneus ventricosus]
MEYFLYSSLLLLDRHHSRPVSSYPSCQGSPGPLSFRLVLFPARSHPLGSSIFLPKNPCLANFHHERSFDSSHNSLHFLGQVQPTEKMFKRLRAILNNTKNGKPYLTIGQRKTANLLLDSIKLKFLEIKEQSPLKQTRKFRIRSHTTKSSDDSQSNMQQEQLSYAKVAQKAAGGGQQPKHTVLLIPKEHADKKEIASKVKASFNPSTIGAKVSGFRQISSGLAIDCPDDESREKIVEKVKVIESLSGLEIKKPEKRFSRCIIYDIPKATEEDVFHSLSQETGFESSVFKTSFKIKGRGELEHHVIASPPRSLQGT